MCGIYAYIGKGAVEEVVNGIKRLEYRGYDSAGISFIGTINENLRKYSQNIFLFDSGLFAVKEEGQVDNLVEITKSIDADGEIAIGHTRWATHGKPSIENSHPHISNDGMWAIVHNGIIENYDKLKNKLEGYQFKSQTDSEVVAGLLQKFFNGNPLDTLCKVCGMLKGSYALSVIFAGQPKTIYVARKNSPVVVGCGEDFGVVCSDVNSMGQTNERFVLEDGQFAVVETNSVKIFDKNQNQIKLNSIKNNKVEESLLGDYPHFMIKEIEEIPNSIIKTASEYNSFEKFDKALPKEVIEKTKNVIIIGCGTAYHASLMGCDVLEKECLIQGNVFIASEFINKAFLWKEDTLAIFVSQSGETADTLKALRLCKEKNLATISITNVKNSTICNESDYLLYTSAGQEIAVASTKAYNSQVAMFHMLSAYIQAVKSGEDKIFKEYRKLCLIAKKIKAFKNKGWCREISKQIKSSESLYMIGRGLDYITAMEASLKLKEISYIHSEALPAGELKHGTISLVTSQTYVFVFANEKKLLDKSLANLSEVASRGGKIILLSQFDIKLGDKNVEVIALPKAEEKYMPLVSIVCMQLVAYYTSLELGYNPDKPRSLAKSVTVE